MGKWEEEWESVKKVRKWEEEWESVKKSGEDMEKSGEE